MLVYVSKLKSITIFFDMINRLSFFLMKCNNEEQFKKKNVMFTEMCLFNILLSK